MSDQPILTDAGLEAMLARRAGHAAPAGLAGAIGAAVAAMPGERRPRWSFLAPPVGRAPAFRLAWVVALVGLLMAAAVSAFLVGSELLRCSAELTVVPPSTVVPIPSAAPLPSVAPMALPAFVSTRPLDRVNDLAFAADGSLWLATGAGVVHWDVAKGSATLYDQHNALPTTDVIRVAVAPDGTVWAGQNWLAHFDGSWTAYSKQGDLGGLEVAGVLGGMAVGADGRVWVAASTSSGSKLLRFDGAWTAIEVPESVSGNASPWGFWLKVAPDGAVWASVDSGLAAFDGATWTSYTTAITDLPRSPWLAGIAPDGSVWVGVPAEGCVATTADSVTCTTPPVGVARFDGARWTVYSTADGLADGDANPFVGPDGTVWVTYGPLPDTVSRFAGGRWVTGQVPELDGASALAVAPDGALWFDSTDGLLRYDGTAVTRHLLPTVETGRDLPPLELIAESGPTVTRSALGTITLRVYEASPEHYFWGMVGTAHGPVVLDGPDLRWLSSDGTWAGTTLPIEGWRVTAAGDDLIVLGWGRAVRLSWDGTRWAPGDALELPGSLDFVYQVATGPRGTVVAGGTSVAWSTDGLHFAEAVRGPVVTAPGPGATGGELVKIGPVFATQDGFVALTPTDNADSGFEPKVWFSADGSTWDLVGSASPFGEGAYVREVASRSGRHVAVGWERLSGSSQEPEALWVSDDGLTWERLPALERPVPCDSACAESVGMLVRVAAAESGWMILARDGAAWTSSDGRTWEQLRGWPGVHGVWSSPSLALDPGTIVASGRFPDPWRDVVVVGTIEP